MMKRLMGMTAVAVFAMIGTVFAHEHKVMGTVTMAAADHLMMKTTDGKTVTVKVTADTKVTKAKQTVKADTIAEGTRVVVTTASDMDPYTAMLIQVGAAPKATAKKK